MRFALVLVTACIASASAYSQTTSPTWSYPPLTTFAQESTPLPQAPGSAYVPASPSSPIPTGLPERTVLAEEYEPAAGGQQHWVSFNFGILQPFTGRVGVKVWSRPNNSLWLEAYGGSVLFDGMYGFGVRVQHTVRDFGTSDHLMVSPGLGVHILPQWATVEKRYDPNYGFSYYDCSYNSLYYLAGDIDISWLHDFSPHFGFEFGVKVGLAGRVSGTVGRDYPRGVMWGKDLYPILSIYSGLRF
jgi:hypothetical protein